VNCYNVLFTAASGRRSKSPLRAINAVSDC